MDKDCLTVPVVTYVLKLEEGKYYVGKSWNLNNRLGQYFTGRGSKWTKKVQASSNITSGAR